MLKLLGSLFIYFCLVEETVRTRLVHVKEMEYNEMNILSSHHSPYGVTVMSKKEYLFRGHSST